jgi:hypothetical protein
MGHGQEVLHADQLRRDGTITWDEYKRLLKGKFVQSAGELMAETARGIRDKDGRLRELEDLGGKG